MLNTKMCYRLSFGKPLPPFLNPLPRSARARSVTGARRESEVGRMDARKPPAFLIRAARRGWFPQGFTLALLGFIKGSQYPTRRWAI